MTPPFAPPRYTEDEYLAIDRAAEERSEYHAGHIYAMSGGTPWHSLIATNLLRRIGDLAERQGCLTFTSDLRIQIAMADSYVYPDMSVIRGAPRFVRGATDIVDNPVLVAEVLSPASELYDRTGKFAKYRTLESLREYLLVSQTEPLIELYSHNQKGRWEYSEARGLDATLEIESLGYTIPLAAVYFGVPLNKDVPQYPGRIDAN